MMETAFYTTEADALNASKHFYGKQIIVRSAHFEPNKGWFINLHWKDGGSTIVSSRLVNSIIA